MQDYHMHSWLCRHAFGRLEEYALRAEALGIDEICFTPHMPFPGYRTEYFKDRIRMDLTEFGIFEEEIAKARAMFPGLSILMGVEAEWEDGVEEFVSRFLSAHDFDFVLMSVHFLSAWPDPEWVFDFDPAVKPLGRRYTDYFRAVAGGIQSGLFDGVAHLDLIKQPGRPVLQTNRDDVAAVLELCRDRGMSMEINTSGLRKKIAEPYPSWEIIDMALDAGVPVTLGSDAHKPDQVGLAFAEMASRYGARIQASTVRYRGRRMVRDGAVLQSPDERGAAQEDRPSRHSLPGQGRHRRIE
jgi:histidinol-phosphatase (PHP family)